MSYMEHIPKIHILFNGLVYDFSEKLEICC